MRALCRSLFAAAAGANLYANEVQKEGEARRGGETVPHGEGHLNTFHPWGEFGARRAEMRHIPLCELAVSLAALSQV